MVQFVAFARTTAMRELAPLYPVWPDFKRLNRDCTPAVTIVTQRQQFGFVSGLQFIQSDGNAPAAIACSGVK